jgi:predicted transcriptional regulator
MEVMSNLAQKIEHLSPASQQRAEGYIDALLDQDRFLASIQAGMEDLKAGRVHDDDEVWRRMEARFGPLGEDAADQ